MCVCVCKQAQLTIIYTCLGQEALIPFIVTAESVAKA